jgi:hypothetical protein
MAGPQKTVTVKVCLKVLNLGTAAAIRVLLLRQTVYISTQTSQNIREKLERNELAGNVCSLIEGIITIELYMYLIQSNI